jgi:hypothetical protein
MPNYMVSLIGDESLATDAAPEVMEKAIADMDAYNEELLKAGVAAGGNGLGPSAKAKTLRYGEGGKPVVTDGPFAESKEQIFGFWIFNCASLEEAVEWAKKAPAEGAYVEVREVGSTAEENYEDYKREQAEKA